MFIYRSQGDEVKNLTDPVVIEFKITNKSYANNFSCVFWDFEANGGLGGWSENGCEKKLIGGDRARCSCSHLTHFGILVVSIVTDMIIAFTSNFVICDTCLWYEYSISGSIPR
jgi:hypothetical protein